MNEWCLSDRYVFIFRGFYRTFKKKIIRNNFIIAFFQIKLLAYYFNFGYFLHVFILKTFKILIKA